MILHPRLSIIPPIPASYSAPDIGSRGTLTDDTPLIVNAIGRAFWSAAQRQLTSPSPATAQAEYPNRLTGSVIDRPARVIYVPASRNNDTGGRDILTGARDILTGAGQHPHQLN
jgi:hypothetical protein